VTARSPLWSSALAHIPFFGAASSGVTAFSTVVLNTARFTANHTRQSWRHCDEGKGAAPPENDQHCFIGARFRQNPFFNGTSTGKTI